MSAAVAEEEWADLLTDQPQVLWSLVADVVKAVKAEEGVRRTGRRPAASVASMDELYELLFPPIYAVEPFTQTLPELMAKRGVSQRAFATQLGLNQATLSRLISGKSAPTVETMERLAVGLQVRPYVFAEYRAAKLAQVVHDAYLADPTMSSDAIRRLLVANIQGGHK